MATDNSNTAPAPAPVAIVPTTASDETAKKRVEAERSAPAKAKAVAEKGDLKVALNLIVQTGADGKSEDVLPGTPFRPAKVDVDFLVGQLAVREPTEAERVMFDHVEKMQADAAAEPSADEALG